ncbi:MAG: HD domain-containing protein [Pirellula sp.]
MVIPNLSIVEEIAIVLNENSASGPTLVAWSQDMTRAFELAVELHREQVRKGTNIPYVSHLMAVCAIVMEYGGDRDAVIAALLHDAAEDQGGMKTIQRISEAFGNTVSEIVLCCSDSLEVVKQPWRVRKEQHLQRLVGFDRRTCLVLAADKLANLQSMERELRGGNVGFWERFRGGFSGSKWYYTAFVDLISDRIDAKLLGELNDCMERVFGDQECHNL